MLRYKTETRPGLVALYDIRPGNGAGPFLQPRSSHGALNGGTQGSSFSGGSPNNAHTVSPRTTKFGRVTRVGRGVFLGGQPHPTPRGWGPSTPQFLGFLSVYAHILCRRTTKFDVVTYMEEGRVSWGQPRLPSQDSGVPACPNFGCSPVFMSTVFNAE